MIMIRSHHIPCCCPPHHIPAGPALAAKHAVPFRGARRAARRGGRVQLGRHRGGAVPACGRARAAAPRPVRRRGATEGACRGGRHVYVCPRACAPARARARARSVARSLARRGLYFLARAVTTLLSCRLLLVLFTNSLAHSLTHSLLLYSFPTTRSSSTCLLPHRTAPHRTTPHHTTPHHTTPHHTTPPPPPHHHHHHHHHHHRAALRKLHVRAAAAHARGRGRAAGPSRIRDRRHVQRAGQ